MLSDSFKGYNVLDLASAKADNMAASPGPDGASKASGSSLEMSQGAPTLQFAPVLRTPSAQGLAMITTTESSPPPTGMEFEDAVRLLHSTERRFRLEAELDIADLRRKMTAAKIEHVIWKVGRLHAMRRLLNNCRVVCRQQEQVMVEFDAIKAGLAAGASISEDGFELTKAQCLKHGGTLTDIRRRQRRLAGDTEFLLGQVYTEGAAALAAASYEEESFDMDRFRRESSQQPCGIMLPTFDLASRSPSVGSDLFRHPFLQVPAADEDYSSDVSTASGFRRVLGAKRSPEPRAPGGTKGTALHTCAHCDIQRIFDCQST